MQSRVICAVVTLDDRCSRSRMRVRLIAPVFALAFLVSLSMGCGDDDAEQGDVGKVCDIIVKQCDAESQGYHLDECLADLKQSSGACLQCVLSLSEPCKLDGNEPSFVTQCHSPSGGCELK